MKSHTGNKFSERTSLKDVTFLGKIIWMIRADFEQRNNRNLDTKALLYCIDALIPKHFVLDASCLKITGLF